jgi:hypothetical protein
MQPGLLGEKVCRTFGYGGKRGQDSAVESSEGNLFAAG